MLPSQEQKACQAQSVGQLLAANGGAVLRGVPRTLMT